MAITTAKAPARQSPLTQGRGLKRIQSICLLLFTFVAPHTGAWIETQSGLGLIVGIVVAPHTGAWIETPLSRETEEKDKVAPHTGAWIETLLFAWWSGLSGCRPSHRGVD